MYQNQKHSSDNWFTHIWVHAYTRICNIIRIMNASFASIKNISIYMEDCFSTISLSSIFNKCRKQKWRRFIWFIFQRIRLDRYFQKYFPSCHILICIVALVMMSLWLLLHSNIVWNQTFWDCKFQSYNSSNWYFI